jgi:hypothetical protein
MPGLPTDYRQWQCREREREEQAYNTEIKSAKIERLCLVRLIRRDPKVTNSRHTKASNK